MLRSIWISACLVLMGSLSAVTVGQTRPPDAGDGGAPAPDKAAPMPMGDMENLVAPIALYPDVLVAQILPASTFPTDIVMAARWLRAKPDMKKLTDQKWDPSVLSLCNYPDVLYKLDADLEWTNALGAAFLDHQQELMNAIQALRAKAKAAGVLQSNEQQTVVQEKSTILIVPPSPQVVYVPQYNPQVIYVEDDDDDDDGVSVAAAATASAISFTAGLALGAWLDMDCNWSGCCVGYCKPGYWGGYSRLYGPTAVAWGNSWAAAVGPRRAGYIGPNGGAYVGPRGGAVWHNGHGAAWARPTPYGRPAYTGRYASYNRYGGSRSNIVAGNNVNVNRNNVNIDRGDRSYYQGGNRNSIQGGDRTNVGSGNRPNYPGAGQTPGGGNRPNYPGAGQTPGGARPTPYGGGSAGGRAGVGGPGAAGGQQRQYSGQRQQTQNRSSGYSSRSSSAFGSSGYGNQVNRSSSRGYSSRGYSGGGGRSRGGGGGGRRR